MGNVIDFRTLDQMLLTAPLRDVPIIISALCRKIMSLESSSGCVDDVDPIMVDEDFPVDVVERLFADHSKIIDVTHCSNEWLDSMLSEHGEVKARMITSCTGEFQLMNLRSINILKVPEAQRVNLPNLIHAEMLAFDMAINVVLSSIQRCSMLSAGNASEIKLSFKPVIATTVTKQSTVVRRAAPKAVKNIIEIVQSPFIRSPA